ncbi:MAG: hypothetical protein VZR09_11965, partial [Candidatus Gastranaerophilaceae bacterium]|nr:hypothetical protein [Candidatus Gastranaerophilaceae bacterium]
KINIKKFFFFVGGWGVGCGGWGWGVWAPPPNPQSPIPNPQSPIPINKNYFLIIILFKNILIIKNN